MHWEEPKKYQPQPQQQSRPQQKSQPQQQQQNQQQFETVKVAPAPHQPPSAIPQGRPTAPPLFTAPAITLLSPADGEIIHESSFTSHVRVDGTIDSRTRVCLQLNGALSKTFCTDPLLPSTLDEQTAGTGRVVPFDLGGLTEGTYRLSSLLIGPRKKLAKAVVNFGIRFN